MSQTKLESIIEQVCNTCSGMVIAYLTMQFILAPMLGIKISPHENLVVTIVLTVVSVLRGYFWRRFFNKQHYKHWANWIRAKIN